MAVPACFGVLAALSKPLQTLMFDEVMARKPGFARQREGCAYRLSAAQ
jgi:hypothetical protein